MSGWAGSSAVIALIAADLGAVGGASRATVRTSSSCAYKVDLRGFRSHADLGTRLGVAGGATLRWLNWCRVDACAWPRVRVRTAARAYRATGTLVVRVWPLNGYCTVLPSMHGLSAAGRSNAPR